MHLKIALTKLREILSPCLNDLCIIDEHKSIIGISTDTRNLQTGELFLVLVGENFDGHNFVTAAVDKGAAAVIVERKLPDRVSQFIVSDTLEAYQRIAHWWRNHLAIPVIAITGSVGKTSTKELISGVLGTQGKVLKTQANYNNEIGVPKTLLEICPEDDYGVIEMGMRGKGEIALLTDIAYPDIGVITNVGTAHIGRLGSREAIAEAKCELLAHMPKSSTAILNYDNPLLIETAAKVWQGKTITYGLTDGDIQGKLIDSETLEVAGKRLPLPLPGVHNASNYLAAIAVAQALGIDITPLTKGITINLPEGRSHRHELPNDIVLLDETYNAGFESMVAALKMLKETPGSRYIAVLGTMKELGEHSASLHQQVGNTVKELNLDLLLVLVDEPATENIITGATGIEGECFHDKPTLIKRLKEVMKTGDRILFKASNSVGLDRVVKALNI